MKHRLLGLGDNTVDTYVDRGLQFPGGNAVNVAVQARRLGAETGYLGCLGSDEAGMLLIDALRSEGVDTTRCRIRPGANARAFIGHDGQDRRFLRSERGVRGEWGNFDAADRAYIASYDLVHSSIYSELGDALPVVRAAAGACPTISPNAGPTRTSPRRCRASISRSCRTHPLPMRSAVR